jgi:uncharacterized membrane protein YidH (DUF202 family)
MSRKGAHRNVDRPSSVFDAGLQHERTALAWERTAISAMVAGVLLGRYGAEDAHFTIALVGIVQVALGGGVLVWAGFHYDDLHGPLRDGSSVIHPTAARVVGISTIVFSSFALALALLLTFID